MLSHPPVAPFPADSCALFRNYTRATIALEAQDDDKIDIYDKPYVGRVFLYIICGMLDAMWQTTAYWIMGAMSNDPAKLANLTGFCESLACVSGVACSFPSPSRQVSPVCRRGGHLAWRRRESPVSVFIRPWQRKK